LEKKTIQYPQLTLSDKKFRFLSTLVSSYFKNRRGEPYQITFGQACILESILNPKYKNVWISAPSRYGKSEVVAIGVIILVVFYHLKVPIVAGSMEKAKKIMEYITQHIGDHEDLYRGLINVENQAMVEKLKIQVSKNALRWSNGGWVYVTSVDSRSVSKEGEGVVGEGGDVTILEEAGLITSKEQYSKIVRMPEDDNGWGKLIQNGNCIEGSVFESAYHNPDYKKVRISLNQAIKEGRVKKSSLRRKKAGMTRKDWKRYMLVRFPEENEFSYFKPVKYKVIPTQRDSENKVIPMEYYGALDPALGEAKKGSLVGIVVLGRDTTTGKVYEVYNLGKQLKPEEAIQTVFNLPYEFTRFGIEAIQFQKYFLDTIETKSQQSGKYIPFEGIQQSRSKTERIESMEPIINTAQIEFSGEGELWNEMQDYPKTESLDVLDTLEMAWRLIKKREFDYAFV